MVEDRDLDLLVRRLSPVVDERLDWVAPAALADAVMAETSPLRTLGRPPRRPRHWVGRAVIMSVAAAAALALVVAGLGSDVRPGINKVTLTMQAAAETASSAAGPSIAAGDYDGWLHLRGESTSVMPVPAHDGDATFSATVSAVYDEWIRADGSGRSRITEGEARFDTDADRAAWEAAGPPRLLMPAMSPHPEDTVDFGPGQYHAGDLAGLPTDAAGLGAELRRRVTAELEAQPAEQKALTAPEATLNLEDRMVFLAAVKLLRPGLLDPARRAALFGVLSGLKGTSVIGTTTDATGRSGTGIALTDPAGGEVRFLFDPATSVLLSEDQTLPGPLGPSGQSPIGTITSSVVYHQAELADTLG